MFFKLINEYRIERKLDIIGKHEKVEDQRMKERYGQVNLRWFWFIDIQC